VCSSNNVIASIRSYYYTQARSRDRVLGYCGVRGRGMVHDGVPPPALHGAIAGLRIRSVHRLPHLSPDRAR